MTIQFQNPRIAVIRYRRPHLFLVTLILNVAFVVLSPACAQVHGEGQLPYLGWSSFSEQTLDGSFLTQAKHHGSV